MKGVLIGLMCTLFSPFGFSMQLSSMFLISEKDGTGVYTVKNTGSQRIFVNTSLSELNVIEGQIETSAYDRTNLADWKVNIRPSRAIIDPGFEKDFRVTHVCEPECALEADEIFKVTFMPAPYFDKQAEQKNHLQMVVGFGAVFLVPGKSEVIDFKAKYDGRYIELSNRQSSFITVTASSCEKKKVTPECSQRFHVLGGRTIQLAIQESLVNKPLSVIARTHDGEFSETYWLPVGEVAR
ncbi:hypothetical protein ACPV47_18575 [Vibrio jasicida]|uniref:hypothetical protein n=1 Tax=Vibrio jasicida TaxID=766224 RepID=UPI0040676AE9